MVTRVGGSRRKSRKKLRKPYKEKGKTPLKNHLQEFEEGDRVLLKADSAVQGGMYNLKFHGRVGTVSGKQGKCYKVRIKDGGKKKEFIVHPVHLRRVKG